MRVYLRVSACKDTLTTVSVHVYYHSSFSISLCNTIVDIYLNDSQIINRKKQPPLSFGIIFSVRLGYIYTVFYNDTMMYFIRAVIDDSEQSCTVVYSNIHLP